METSASLVGWDGPWTRNSGGTACAWQQNSHLIRDAQCLPVDSRSSETVGGGGGKQDDKMSWCFADTGISQSAFVGIWPALEGTKNEA